MKINKMIFKEISKDIIRCNECNKAEGSQELFELILFKYKQIDEKFGKGLPTGGKASSVDGSFNYVRDVHTLAEQLRIIQLNYIPPNESLTTMLDDDIQECALFIENSPEIDSAKTLYNKLTSRYDSLIVNLGDGLYSYISFSHFYDSDVSLGALTLNINALYNKLLIYRGTLTSADKKSKLSKATSNKVFVVHGHDYIALKSLKDYLTNIGLEPIVLKDKPSKSNTVIDKFEKYSDVSYAVVLYTSCDVGKSRRNSNGPEKFRARQNVIFEHGYLIGSLGRENTCVLIKGEIEKPSDIAGMIFITMDKKNNWQNELKMELKSADIL
ncbi:MAG: nucleotide-binding protein [Erysipelotrichaceae bacterium]